MKDPLIKIESKSTPEKKKEIFQTLVSRHFYIYKCLNTNTIKRVINEYKPILDEIVIGNQMFTEIIRVASMGELRK